MTDAFDSLRLPDEPLDPSVEFATSLHVRVQRALGISTPPTVALATPSSRLEIRNS
jgi:hypothetical protein